MAHGLALRGTVIRASCGRGYSLNLNSNRLKSVPEFVSRFPNLSVLLLCHNSISDLPTQLQSLRHLTELNLGNNALREFPVVLSHLGSLTKLDLYNNKIAVVSPDAIGNLGNLVVLNLNHNNIQRLPPEIGRLRKLQHFSIVDNKLEELPGEVGCLKKLSELNLTYNNLSSLPKQLYFCRNLIKLYAARNRLTNLPEVGTGCQACFVRSQKEVLADQTEPSSLPRAERPVVQQQVLYGVQWALPRHLGGVRAFCQSAEGDELEELAHYSSPGSPVFIQLLQSRRTLLLWR
ncbi:leucine-rich repeat-containing protein 69 isoform X3 [Poecilia formosa]|uniref:leucine-rich repeat-containing protein 69 isoform X3 n=1 Tax=Poecilia formosa TaxID=48698 RepID=UPI0007B79338|nr:PREDICTED: leucine-rich repeat-containing protein 69 isoform X3 [Poecilia formosa]